jgi:hypothetical protein
VRTVGNGRRWVASTGGIDRRWAARAEGNDRRWTARTGGSDQHWAARTVGHLQEHDGGWKRAYRAFVEGSQRESCRPTSRLVLLVPMAKERPVHSRGWFGRTSNFERSLVEVRGVRMGVGMVFPANLSCIAARVSELWSVCGGDVR